MQIPNEYGASMIEILVTLVIVALGLLGIAGIKLVGLQDTNLAYQISVATFQAQDMAERISANRVAKAEYNGLTWIPERTSCEGDETNCTSEQIAKDDFWLWNDTNRKIMPQGNGRVLADGDDYLIAVKWADPQLRVKASDINNLDTTQTTTDSGTFRLGWDSAEDTDVYNACGDPSDEDNNGFRCYVLRYRP